METARARSIKSRILRAIHENVVREWNEIPPFWQKDYQIASAAYAKELISEDVLLDVKKKALLREAMEDLEMRWEELPDDLYENQEFAKSLNVIPNCIVNEIFGAMPILRHDRGIWETIVASSSVCCVSTAVRLEAPASIRSDRELLLKACQQEYGEALQWVAPQLKVDRSFLEAVLQSNPHVLKYLSADIQRLYPDLVQQYLGAFARCTGDINKRKIRLARCIVPELWNSRAFVLTWFQAGLPFVGALHSSEWNKDKEIFLLIAKHGNYFVRRTSFPFVAPYLREDKAFMTQVLQLDPMLLLTLT